MVVMAGATADAAFAAPAREVLLLPGSIAPKQQAGP
jgi:hypothetical protein